MHRSFWEWQRVQAERVFLGGVFDWRSEETFNTEAEAAGRVLKRSIFNTKFEQDRWKKKNRNTKGRG
jgi:hypothetical protein